MRIDSFHILLILIICLFVFSFRNNIPYSWRIVYSNSKYYSVDKNHLKLSMTKDSIGKNKFLNDQSKYLSSDNKRYRKSLLQTVQNSMNLFWIGGLILRVNNQKVDAGTGEEDGYIDALVTMLLAKEIISPTNVAVDLQAYDTARTNIKYVLNQLQFQKKVEFLIKNSIDYCDDLDAIDAATEASGRIGNLFLQYDGSIYTCVFIPSEDGDIPPSAKKYRKEAINYYDNILSDLNTLLKLGNEKQLAQADSIAKEKIKTLPKVLFFSKDSLKKTGIA